MDTVCAAAERLTNAAAIEPPGVAAVSVAVIDGPYDALKLSEVLARAPINLGKGGCGASPSSACDHGTFVMGILGARRDAKFPGLCPGCQLVHIPLFLDEHAPWASISELANAITVAVAGGAQLLNLSLGILGDDTQNDRRLTAALDYAEAKGTVVVAAAGNQGRLAVGQLLSHPVTIPVVAVDALGRLLPDCNLGPDISCRGIAALGHRVLGYAPGGGTAVMSGTSVATAVATGTLAQLWSLRPKVNGAEIRAAVMQFASREGPMPPILDGGNFIKALDQICATKVTEIALISRGNPSCASLQGEPTMSEQNGLTRLPDRDVVLAARLANTVTPAQSPGGCACGAPSGMCTCENVELSPSRFVYVLGSVDIRFPDQSISEELQAVASMLSKKAQVDSKVDGRSLKKRKVDRELEQPGDEEELRAWFFRVLQHPEARYVARQVCWVLKVEGQFAYYLTLRDLHDLDGLIHCLGHPEDDLDLFVGSSSLIPLERCQGIAAPLLAVDHFHRFEEVQMTSWMDPKSKGILNPPSKASVAHPNASNKSQLFKKLVQSADNFGDTDQSRALNYLAVNCKQLYEQCARMVIDGWTLDSVKVVSSRLWRDKHIVDPVFTFRQLETGNIQKYFVRVDVSYLFPMITNTIAEYFDR